MTYTWQWLKPLVVENIDMSGLTPPGQCSLCLFWEQSVPNLGGVYLLSYSGVGSIPNLQWGQSHRWIALSMTAGASGNKKKVKFKLASSQCWKSKWQKWLFAAIPYLTLKRIRFFTVRRHSSLTFDITFCERPEFWHSRDHGSLSIAFKSAETESPIRPFNCALSIKSNSVRRVLILLAGVDLISMRSSGNRFRFLCWRPP